MLILKWRLDCSVNNRVCYAVTGQNVDAAVILMESGNEQELTRAPSASFNNPGRAAKMLMSVSLAG